LGVVCFLQKRESADSSMRSFSSRILSKGLYQPYEDSALFECKSGPNIERLWRLPWLEVVIERRSVTALPLKGVDKPETDAREVFAAPIPSKGLEWPTAVGARSLLALSSSHPGPSGAAWAAKVGL
jgi:hypothetical protein